MQSETGQVYWDDQLQTFRGTNLGTPFGKQSGECPTPDDVPMAALLSVEQKEELAAEKQSYIDQRIADKADLISALRSESTFLKNKASQIDAQIAVLEEE